MGGERDRDEAPGPLPGAPAHPRPLRDDPRTARGPRRSGRHLRARRRDVPCPPDPRGGERDGRDRRPTIGRPGPRGQGRGPDLRRGRGPRTGRAGRRRRPRRRRGRARDSPRIDRRIRSSIRGSTSSATSSTRSTSIPTPRAAGPASRRVGPSTRIGSPRRSARRRFTQRCSRSRQKSRTARRMTDGRAPVADPAVRG